MGDEQVEVETYCSKRKEWFHGPSSDPGNDAHRRQFKLGGRWHATPTSRRLTEHDVPRPDEHDIEVGRPPNVGGPAGRVCQKERKGS